MGDRKFIDILLGVVGALLTVVVGWVGMSLVDLNKGVGVLNVSMSAMMEKVNTHETRLYRLEGNNYGRSR